MAWPTGDKASYRFHRVGKFGGFDNVLAPCVDYLNWEKSGLRRSANAVKASAASGEVSRSMK